MRDSIQKAVFLAVEDVNRQLSKSQRLTQTLDTPLIGSSGTLDSLGAINFVVAVEDRVRKTLHTRIVLTEVLADPSKHDVFRTVGTLCDYILETLKEKMDG
jgi:acyl carrier protein